MTRFFNDITTLHQFTMDLDLHRNSVKCQNCSIDNHFVSHGFVYRQINSREKKIVGKRIFCSNRYGNSGCGTTLRLYINQYIPSLRYEATHIALFLSALIANICIRDAYEQATGTPDPRNAYRWLRKFESKLIDYRGFLKTRTEHNTSTTQYRTRRFQILLPTVQAIFHKLDQCACARYQAILQDSFI